MLAPCTMWKGMKETPWSGEVQEQEPSLQKLPVGKQLTNVDFKIILSNSKEKQQKLIKFS